MGRGSRALAALTAAASLLPAAAVQAQSDPFAALTGNGSPPPSTIGATSVGTAVGRTYAGAQEKGAISLAQLAFMPKTVAPFPVRLDGWNEKFLNRRPRVAVATYGFGLVRGASASASAAGRGSEIAPRRTKVATYLSGVSDDMAAKLADEAYRDLVAQLQAAGVEVVPAEQVLAAPHMQTIGRHPGAALNGKAAGAGWTTYAPAAVPLIKGYANEGGLGGLAASGSLLSLGHVSKELDAVVLVPRLMLDNVALESSGRKMFVSNASVDAEVRFSITPASRTDFVWGNDKGGAMPGALTIKGFGSDEPFAVMVQADDRSDSRMLHNSLVEAGFGSVYRQSLVYAVEADPNRFAALSRAAFKGYNAAIVAAVVRARTSANSGG